MIGERINCIWHYTCSYETYVRWNYIVGSICSNQIQHKQNANIYRHIINTRCKYFKHPIFKVQTISIVIIVSALRRGEMKRKRVFTETAKSFYHLNIQNHHKFWPCEWRRARFHGIDWISLNHIRDDECVIKRTVGY